MTAASCKRIRESGSHSTGSLHVEMGFEKCQAAVITSLHHSYSTCIFGAPTMASRISRKDLRWKIVGKSHMSLHLRIRIENCTNIHWYRLIFQWSAETLWKYEDIKYIASPWTCIKNGKKSKMVENEEISMCAVLRNLFRFWWIICFGLGFFSGSS